MNLTGIADGVASVGRGLHPTITAEHAGVLAERLGGAADELKSLLETDRVGRTSVVGLSQDHDAIVGFQAMFQHIAKSGGTQELVNAKGVREGIAALGKDIRSGASKGVETPYFEEIGGKIGRASELGDHKGVTAARITSFNGRPSDYDVYYAKTEAEAYGYSEEEWAKLTSAKPASTPAAPTHVANGDSDPIVYALNHPVKLNETPAAREARLAKLDAQNKANVYYLKPGENIEDFQPLGYW